MHRVQVQEAVLAFLGKRGPQLQTRSIPTPRSCFSRRIGSSRSNVRSACPFSTIRPWRNASRPVTRSLSSTSLSRRRSIAASSRLREGKNGFEVGGDGPTVEWAVEMARFDESETFDHLARRGKITPELAETLAAVIRRHTRARAGFRRHTRGSHPLPASSIAIPRHSMARQRLHATQSKRLHELSHQQLCDCRALMQTRAIERLHSPLPWRRASRQYRPDRRAAGAVRCDRVRSRDRDDGYSL